MLPRNETAACMRSLYPKPSPNDVWDAGAHLGHHLPWPLPAHACTQKLEQAGLMTQEDLAKRHQTNAATVDAMKRLAGRQ